MELGSDMESIYQGLNNTRLKQIIEDVLALLFPPRIGNGRVTGHRPWWEDYESESLDPFRPFKRGEEGVKPSQEGSFETPKQRRNRAFMSPENRDVKRQADARRRQETERNYRSSGTTPTASQELARSLENFKTNRLRASLAD